MLNVAGDDTPVNGYMQLKVAEGQRVTAEDLLSVLGVPFRRTSCNAMSVQLGAWSIRAMLEAKTVAWTDTEVRRQIEWMRDAGASDDELDSVVRSIVG